MSTQPNLSNTTIWFTGLPCSGKTTLAKALISKLKDRCLHVTHLDGDDVRRGLCVGLGFTPDGRAENLRRIAHVCNLFNAADVMVLASFVSPTEDYRYMLKGIIKNFKLVYVKCSQAECERRDVKGMWQKARLGQILGFTGIDSDFDIPGNPDLILDTEKSSIDDCVGIILKTLID